MFFLAEQQGTKLCYSHHKLCFVCRSVFIVCIMCVCMHVVCVCVCVCVCNT